jgi:hypothetical protein
MDNEHHGWDDDASTAPQLAVKPDLDNLDDPLDELREIVNSDGDASALLAEWMQRRGCDNDAMIRASELFRVAIISILEARNPKQEAWTWAMASGMECTLGIKTWQLADRFGLTSAAMSKNINDRIDKYGLSRNRNVKSNLYRRINSELRSGKKKSEYINVRQVKLFSIEGVLNRFLGWCKVNKVNDNLGKWPTERLLVVQENLRPMVELHALVTAAINGRRL